MKTKIQIKTISGRTIFELEQENNTIKDTLIAGFRSGADLRYADLRGAVLRYADLRDADLSGANLRYADLRDADLSGANLRYANLSYADLRGANISDADLHGANLSHADLSYADLSYADLRYAKLIAANLHGANLSYADLRYAKLIAANLHGANLSYADLYCADLRYADLSYADLSYADLRDANLRGATKVPFVPFACPSEGSFIGWKKIYDYIIKLEIPEDAKRCSATTNKCRCDRAKVLSITSIKSGEEIKELCNAKYSACVYKVGEMVYPDKFDDDRWNECSNGIHFFIKKQEAINY